MRRLLIMPLLLGSTSLAWALSPDQCALPGPDQDGPVPATPTAAAAPPTGVAASTSLVALPFLKHVADSGAALTDLGSAHGLRRVAARTGEEFQVFQVLEDGSAAVSGPPVELSPAEMTTIAGAGITELGSSHGFTGYFVRSGGHFQVFYATPDGERLIPGVLWDAAGKDITRQQVSSIPGAIPTVEVTDGKPAAAAVPAAATPLLEKASFGLAGKEGAPRVYMLIDPQCVYSIRAMQTLKPFIDAGRLQLAVVPLSILDYEDQGASTQAALALLSKPGEQIVSAWQARDVSGAPTPEAGARLRLNMQIAEALGAKGTPVFLWRRADGGEGRIDGLPANVSEMIASLGT